MRTNLRISLPTLMLVLALSACQPTRHVPAGKYMLQRNPTLKAEKRLPVGELEDAIQLEANRKIITSRFYLGLYNIGTSLKKDTSFVRRQLLRINRLASFNEQVVKVLTETIGEPPALVDLEQIEDDSLALRNVCLANGFFHPEISWQVDTQRSFSFTWDPRMARVTYDVKGGTRYMVNEVRVLVNGEPAADSVLELLKWADSRIREEEVYEQSSLVRERGRLTDLLRDQGFFTFSPAAISFFVDTLTNDNASAALERNGDRWLNIDVEINQLPVQYTVSEIEMRIRQDGSDGSTLYKRSVRIRADRITRQEYERLGLTPRVLADTLKLAFEVDEELIPKLNFNFLAARVHLKEGEPYSQRAARLTLQRLQELGMLRFVTIKYELSEETQKLRVILEAQMAPHYQVKAGMESFYNSVSTIGNNLPSIGGNIGLRNRNTFSKSEQLEFGLTGSIGFYSTETEGPSIQSLFYGLGSQVSMNIPGLVVPFAGRRDFSALSPTTLLSSDVVLDQRREYRRVKVGARASYRWNHEPFSTQAVSELTPFLLEFIDTQTDSTFQADIVDKLPPAIRRDFEQRISSRIQYAFTYQDYRSTRARPTSWSRFAVELGGNLPYLLDNFQFLRNGTSDTSSRDQLLAGRLFYGQYVKASAEIKYNIPFRNQSDLVFRVFMGGAVPFNGTPAVPRESRFFSGGPGSMRGWRSNTLGPGTLSLEDLADENNQFQGNGLSLVAPGGEWIFEANAEYRFKLFPPYFELGLFTDVGNVWFHNSSRIIEQVGEEAVISPENFRLGWDAGIGFRFDFDLVILRVDFGQQIYAPDIGWVVTRTGLLRFPEPSIGVDYPF